MAYSLIRGAGRARQGVKYVKIGVSEVLHELDIFRGRHTVKTRGFYTALKFEVRLTDWAVSATVE